MTAGENIMLNERIDRNQNASKVVRQMSTGIDEENV